VWGELEHHKLVLLLRAEQCMHFMCKHCFLCGCKVSTKNREMFTIGLIKGNCCDRSTKDEDPSWVTSMKVGKQVCF
jgi:hypothetical protein